MNDAQGPKKNRVSFLAAACSAHSAWFMRITARKAFTLIELLIVVAIIGILAAIAVPNFLNARMRAKIARSESSLRTIDFAFTAYLLDAGLSREQSKSAVKHNANGCWQQRPFTTPIAYMAHALRDPFQEGRSPEQVPHGQYCFHFDPLLSEAHVNAFMRGMPNNTYLWTQARHSIGIFSGHGPTLLYETGMPIYAPSNGLISHGGIARFIQGPG